MSTPDVNINHPFNRVLVQFAGRLTGETVLDSLPHDDQLDRAALDYSRSSLKVVDAWLTVLFLDRGSLLSMPGTVHEVAVRVGAYVGEVIRRSARGECRWMDYPECISTQGREVAERMGPPSTGALAFISSEAGILTPLSKVLKFLDEGPRHSMYTYVSIVPAKDGTSDPSNALRMPLIFADPVHDQVTHANGAAENYDVVECDALLLDCGDVLNGSTEADRPDMLVVIIDEATRYQLPLEPGKTRYQLDANSLKANVQGVAFEGFKAGQRLKLVLGRRTYDVAQNKPVLKVRWMALVDISSPGKYVTPHLRPAR